MIKIDENLPVVLNVFMIVKYLIINDLPIKSKHEGFLEIEIIDEVIKEENIYFAVILPLKNLIKNQRTNLLPPIVKRKEGFLFRST